MFFVFFFSWYGDHRDLHVLTHSFPTRRSSDLRISELLSGVRSSWDMFARNSDLYLLERCNSSARSSNWICARFSSLFFRSEEHTSELQSLMRISYAVFCLKKKTHRKTILLQYSKF